MLSAPQAGPSSLLSCAVDPSPAGTRREHQRLAHTKGQSRARFPQSSREERWHRVLEDPVLLSSQIQFLNGFPEEDRELVAKQRAWPCHTAFPTADIDEVYPDALGHLLPGPQAFRTCLDEPILSSGGWLAATCISSSLAP